jgi:hypothetical protein
MGVTQPPTPDFVAAQPYALRPGFKAINSKKVAQVVVALAMIALAALSIGLYAAGANKNSQIHSLQQHGRTMSVKVAGCEGLLGGSGSNAAGYQCNVSFTLAGHRYVENMPGNVLRRPGNEIQAVVVPSDPALINTPGAVRAEHASGRVFILPTLLLLVFLMCAGMLLLQRKSRKSRA